jgi:2-oxoglutarate/2-oxoacid ferredoxin oxidoreductase subunit alpha
MKEKISIVLSGEAGQGIQTIENILPKVLKLSGLNVFATKEYMSRVRGGTNSTTIIVSSNRIDSYYEGIDILVPLDKGRTKHLSKRITKDTVILGEKESIAESCEKGTCRIIEVPYSRIATELGNAIYSNIVAVGVISGIFGIDLQVLHSFINKYFASKDVEIISKNIEASTKGYDLGKALTTSGQIKCDVKANAKVKDEIIISGSEAIALGAIAGGCNFVSAYPMTPSTGVFTFLAQNAAQFGMVVEQAEDEISALNMSLGAWYAGARAFVTTSGGGYDLMQEALSLAGMLESPAVIALGMRPGPATGLPTRTEQGDLDLALYSGHGEFPRIILAPGTLEQAFELSAKAFNLADKYQVPVFILFDQYFGDSYHNVPQFDVSKIKIENNITRTSADYNRYKVTDNGLSPRGIPGYGDGLVVLDSDEHDEAGHITEDLELRARMVEKKLKKGKEIEKIIVNPSLVGDSNYEKLIIAWGSNYNIIAEAIKDMKKTAMLHFSQVFPLHPDTIKFLKKAKRTILVENNPTGQLGELIKLKTGVNINNRILKYDGLPFSVEELEKKIREIK